MRDSFVFYKSFYEAIETLPKTKKVYLYNAIVRFALFSEEPKLDGALQGMFNLIKPQLNANLTRYENGKKGGRPRNQKETEEKPNNNQKKTESEPNVNVNVNDNVNGNVNVNVNGLGFSTPTLEQLFDFALEEFSNYKEKDLKKSCTKFLNYYEEKNWNKVKNWQSKLKLWINDDIENNKIKPKNEDSNCQIGSTKGLQKL